MLLSDGTGTLWAIAFSTGVAGLLLAIAAGTA